MALFAEIVLPLALPNRTYTYEVPQHLATDVSVGKRVEVPLGKTKLYAGLVERLHQQPPDFTVKSIISVLDAEAVVWPWQFELWDWMANYYCSTLGEVMLAALPGHLKLTSETSLVLSPECNANTLLQLDNDEYLVAEALQIQQHITIEDATQILGRKNIYAVVQRLLSKGVLQVQESLQHKYKPKTIQAVRLAEPYRSAPHLLEQAFQSLDKNEKQAEVLMALLQLSRNQPIVKKRTVKEMAHVGDSTLQTLVKKGILEIYEQEISHIASYDLPLQTRPQLSPLQLETLHDIKQQFSAQQTVLLHGVTGSGKTEIYIELIQEVISNHGQVLYMLPEIALTTQIIQRLQRIFGNDVAVYHSKINYNERVEVWHAARQGKPVLLGARSSIFLPFKNLQLIIVDEEHDTSFKQFDPAPRYNARDTAIYLAQMVGAKVLLGTATPSVESWHNAYEKKYGLVILSERFGGAQLPEIQMISLKTAHQKKEMHSMFSLALLDGMRQTLAQGEQILLFQNRRGFSPILECEACHWNSMCPNCDVSLTYHKQSQTMCCHYCHHQEAPVAVCPACGSKKLLLRGFGTEKIEDEIKIFFPAARVGRLDYDTADSRSKLTDILQEFKAREIDILVGTQMVTKGLDFDNVGMVGVLSADAMLKFPDFRSNERAYQMLTQVAGRAGRKNKRGQVIVQAWNIEHPVLREVVANDFAGFMERELQERQQFKYPPFFRLIHLEVRHKVENVAKAAAETLTSALRQQLAHRVVGPTPPRVSKVRGKYLLSIMLKLEKNQQVIRAAKALLKQHIEQLTAQPNFRQVMVAVDADPV